MKRREFLATTSGLLAGALPLKGFSAPLCSPQISAGGGTTGKSSCGNGTAPSWFTSMADKTWSTPVTNTLDAVKPSSLPAGNTGHRAICDAWTGGCVDQDTGEFMLVANGGHSDYGGNEAYACNLTAASPQWVGLNNPSATSGGTGARDSVGNYGDGAPRSVHGYNRCVYGAGRVWYAGLDGMYVDGYQTKACYSLRRSDLVWTFHGNPSVGGANWEAGVAAFDRIGNKVWSAAGYATDSGGYSVDTSNTNFTITPYDWYLPNTRFKYGWSAIAYDKSPRCWIVGSVSESVLYVLNLEDPTTGWVQKTTTGSPAGWESTAGAVYHAPSSGILVYDKSYGTSIRKLSVPSNPLTGSYAWSTIASGGGATPPGTVSSDYQGTFSKFNIVDDMGNGQSALCLVCSTTGKTYVFKLPSNGV